MKLPPDWNEFIDSLIAHRVRFLVVGAHALALHGRPRATADLDVLVEPTVANARRLGAALAKFGFPDLAREWERFSRPDRMVVLGREPLRIDLMTSITGVSFANAWAGRTRARFGTHVIGFLGLKQFLRNKRASGRAKDLLDIELLRGR